MPFSDDVKAYVKACINIPPNPRSDASVSIIFKGEGSDKLTENKLNFLLIF